VLTEQRDQIDFNQLSEFLLVAAILIELKSQKLLPGRESADDDDELVGWEERDLQLARLLEGRAYAAAADVFVAMTEQAARSVPREAGLPDDFAVHAPDLLAGVTPEDLAQAYLRGAAERPVPRVDLSHVTVDTVSVAEAVTALIEIPKEDRATSFRSLVAACTTRMEVIVRFLEVEIASAAGPHHVLLPMTMSVIDGEAKKVKVGAITAAQFANVPVLRDRDQVTLLEEDRITAYYAGGQMYALPGRSEPLL